MKSENVGKKAENLQRPIPALMGWRIYFALALLQSLLAVVRTLSNASAPDSQLFLGLSFSRWVFTTTLFVVTVGFCWLLIRSWTRPDWCQAMQNRLEILLAKPTIYASLVVLSAALFLVGGYFVTLAPEIQEPFTQAVVDRLSPTLLWISGLGLQTLAVLVIFRFRMTDSSDPTLPSFLRKNTVFFITLGFFVLIILGWFWVVANTFERESGITGWNDLGTPLLESQVFLAWLAGMLVWTLILIAERVVDLANWLRVFHPRVIDLTIALILWVGTALLWNSVPAVPSYFLSQVRAPNYEMYPNSDALAYDMSAQTLLVGEGVLFANDIYVRRPMLALFFAGLHALAGQDYNQIATWQVLFLSSLPALVYLLTRLLGNRLAAVIAAVLVSLRGANAIALAGVITTSHAKLLMADLPASLAMVSFIYAGVLWLQNQSQLLGVLTGGLLGIAILIRPELAAAIFAVIFISWLVYRPWTLKWLRQLLLFSLGVVLVLMPWILRNWSLTGQVFLDTPTFRTDWLQGRYQLGAPSVTPSVTPQAPLKVEPRLWAFPSQVPEVEPPEAGETNLEQILDFIGQNFQTFSSFVTSHYLNSQLQTLLILPSTIRPLDGLVTFWGHRSMEKFFNDCCSAEKYVRRLPYWHRWDGRLPSQAIIPLVVSLVLIALGIQTTWKKERWIGLFPLTVGLMHLLVNALARNSGGRYITPVDWIALVYFSCGLGIASIRVVNLFWSSGLHPEGKFEVDPEVVEEPKRERRGATRNIFTRPAFYVLALSLLMIGSLLPILERVIPPRYPEEVRSTMLKGLLESPDLSLEQRSALVNLLQSEATVTAGRILYPRFYPPEQGEPGRPDPLEPKPYPRLGFYLVNRLYQAFNFPLDQAPSTLPNGADALVVGCPNGEAVALAIYTEPGSAPMILLVHPDLNPGFMCRSN